MGEEQMSGSRDLDTVSLFEFDEPNPKDSNEVNTKKRDTLDNSQLLDSRSDNESNVDVINPCNIQAWEDAKVHKERKGDDVMLVNDKRVDTRFKSAIGILRQYGR
ncbi:hypothetical protein V6N11_060220 [Hibiscus sabdariffa]|uniref:Uncharacterized protein n=1 Tax=Hibiscus sabdariffa TaxID=183260 RepID=A0ABR1ZC86_9ROSI